ncbi:MAG: type II toxin-antitoxin system RelE/ParE family toxin [Methylocella sp.]
MTIVWSPQALGDLKEAYLKIAPDNPRAARALHERIVSCVSLLLTSPHIGRPGRVAGTREMVVSGTSYIVPYRVAGERVQILRVYHSSRQWPVAFDT